MYATYMQIYIYAINGKPTMRLKKSKKEYKRKGNDVVRIQKEEIIKNVFPFCLHWNLKPVLLNGRISLQTHWRKDGGMYPQLRHND